ncbi:Platelet-activating factor acetylhydrolase-like protein 1 [Elsinoe fawcettii]|nr:Platelet-activating factor acetylhydrolase-like protein 1 [Elsinoe fawcettii]
MRVPTQLSVLSWALLPLTSAILMPRPPGPYSVTSTTTLLTDPSRLIDSLPRRLMISSYFPTSHHNTCSPVIEPYQPPFTALLNAQIYSTEFGVPLPNNTFSQFTIESCAPPAQPLCDPWPLTILTPGLGASRYFYSALASRVAAKGYIVVLVDIPEQAGVVEYPDGSAVYLNATQSTAERLDERVGDIALTKSAVLRGGVLPEYVRVDENRLALWGGSLGGAGAAQAMLTDADWKGGIDMDGSIWPPATAEGVDGKFLIFGKEGYNDSSWWEFLEGDKGEGKIWLELQGSQHATFGDWPLIVQGAGITGPAAEVLVGSIEGARVLEVVGDVVDAFFKWAFGEEQEELLAGEDDRYPEVTSVDFS